jgi:hypothetical protein
MYGYELMTDTNNTILKNKRSTIEVLQCNKWEKNKEINLMKCKPIWALFFNSLKSHQHRRKFKAWHAKRQSRCDILQIWSSKKEKKSKKQLVITSLWERERERDFTSRCDIFGAKFGRQCQSQAWLFVGDGLSISTDCDRNGIESTE